MRNLIISITILITGSSFSQIPCFSDWIQFNKVMLPVSPYAAWTIPEVSFNYCNGTYYQQYIPIDSGSTIHYSQDILMGKSAQSGAILGTIENQYFQLVNGDYENGNPTSKSFRMGPYSPNAVAEEINWRKTWLLTRWEIDQHVANFNNVGYTMPVNIETWPAHGDTILGESFYLAPFYDHNSNGIYDPENGDYPLIKGDKCVYAVFNDIINGAGSTQLTQQLNVEVHKMTYSMNCLQDSALNYAVFNDLRIINKGLYAIDSLIYSQYSQFHIGCSSDDYAGTNVELGAVYSYNGDNFDEDCLGADGFNGYSPAQGYSVLKGFKRLSNGSDDGQTHLTPGSYNGLGFSDGIIDNEYYGLHSAMITDISTGSPNPWSTSPTNYLEFWNYFNAIWVDGEEMLFGGVGHPYNAPTNYRTYYAYPGHSDPNHFATGGIDPGFIWSEDSLNNTRGDRSHFASTIGETLAPGEEQTITNMFIYARDRQNPGPHASVYKMEGFVQDIRNYFANNQTPCGETFDYYMAHQFLGLEEKNLEDLISIYPNPTNNSIQISGIEDEVSLRIYDTRGQLLKVIKNFKNGTVDLSLFENGIYLIQLELDGQVIVKKIVKQ